MRNLMRIAAACALLALAVSYPPLATLLGLEMPEPREWLVVLVLGLVPGLLGQAVKALSQAG